MDTANERRAGTFQVALVRKHVWPSYRYLYKYSPEEPADPYEESCLMYTYLQEHHISSVNALLQDSFWDGIDSKLLQPRVNSALAKRAQYVIVSIIRPKGVLLWSYTNVWWLVWLS